MRPFAVNQAARVQGAVSLPGDKSIAHRAAILSAVSGGKTTILNFPYNHDCLATIDALEKLGVKIKRKFSKSFGGGSVTVCSPGLFGMKKPKGPFFVGESGTTIRLLAGLLAGQDFASNLTCGKALSRRPMRRICEPLRMMGADITLQQTTPDLPGMEPAGDIFVRGSVLKGVTIKEKEVPFLIDEIPVLMVAACLARGRTVIKGAQELRVKETDRIRAMSYNLARMAGKPRSIRRGQKEDIIINGVLDLRGAQVKSFGDHRIAMSMFVAGSAAQGATGIDDVSCIDKSFPGFIKAFKSLINNG